MKCSICGNENEKAAGRCSRCNSLLRPSPSQSEPTEKEDNVLQLILPAAEPPIDVYKSEAISVGPSPSQPVEESNTPVSLQTTKLLAFLLRSLAALKSRFFHKPVSPDIEDIKKALDHAPKKTSKIPRWVYISLVAVIVLGAVVVVVRKITYDPFPLLCSGNFQSAELPSHPVVSSPATRKSPDGEPIGLSRGEQIFDLQRPDEKAPGVQAKLYAAQAMINRPDQAIPPLRTAVREDPTDAEAKIYLENANVLGSRHPHITFVVGVSFVSSYASRNALQGAYTAQKECNQQSDQDNSKMRIVLIIANIGGYANGDVDNESTKFVADQIVDHATKDPTIVGIMGWPVSAATIDVLTELQAKGSKLPMLAACSASDYLSGKDHFFRVCPIDKMQAQIAADFVLKKQKRKIAILFQLNNPWTDSLQHDFAESMPKGTIAASESYIGGNAKTVQSALNKVLTQNPDAIYFAGYPSDLIKLLDALSSTSYANLFIMGGSALSVTNAYPNPLPDLHNVYFTGHASPNQWDGVNLKPPFFQKYKEHFGTLTAPTGLPSIDASVMLAYDGMLTLLYASQIALQHGTAIPPHLEDGLKQITETKPIQGITGCIAFDSSGDQDSSKMMFVEHIVKTNIIIDEEQGCLQVPHWL